jgi:hypothetical protein
MHADACLDADAERMVLSFAPETCLGADDFVRVFDSPGAEQQQFVLRLRSIFDRVDASMLNSANRRFVRTVLYHSMHVGCCNVLSYRMLLLALRHDEELASPALTLPTHVKHTDTRRRAFEDIFEAMGAESSSTTSWEGFIAHFSSLGVSNEDACTKDAVRAGGTFFCNRNLDDVGSWSEQQDAETGEVYYKNSETGEINSQPAPQILPNAELGWPGVGRCPVLFIPTHTVAIQFRVNAHNSSGLWGFRAVARKRANVQSKIVDDGFGSQRLPWLQSYPHEEEVVEEEEVKPLPPPQATLDEYEVVLHLVDGRKLGLGLQCVVRESDGSKDLSTIQVADVVEGDAAWYSKEIEKGDVLLDVNECTVAGLPFEAVTELFKRSPEHIHLKLQRSAAASASRAQARQEQEQLLLEEAEAARALEIPKQSPLELAAMVAEELQLLDYEIQSSLNASQVLPQLAAAFLDEDDTAASEPMPSGVRMDLSVVDTSTLQLVASQELEGAGLEARNIASLAQAVLPLRMALAARDWPLVNELVQEKSVSTFAEAARAQNEVSPTLVLIPTYSNLVRAVPRKGSGTEDCGNPDARL